MRSIPGILEQPQVPQKIEGINCTSSEKGLLDIMAANVDKGTGVAQPSRSLVSVRKKCASLGTT